MIGLPSLLLELAFPTFLVVMFLAALADAVRRRNGGSALLAVLVLGFAWLVGSRFYHQVESRRFLQSLRPEEVRRIRIGEKRITRPEQVAAVVRALNRIEWFSANHGGWGDMQWLVVDLKAGGERGFLAAKYHRQEGGIVSFGRATAVGRFHDGYAFCPSLPATLEALGISLEPEDRVRR